VFFSYKACPAVSPSEAEGQIRQDLKADLHGNKKPYFKIAANWSAKANPFLEPTICKRCRDQGCQMVNFQTKKPNLDNFWRVLQWKKRVYFMDIWSILQQFGILCVHLAYFVYIWHILWTFGIFCGHLAYFALIWYILPCFCVLCQEKSGNPGRDNRTHLINDRYQGSSERRFDINLISKFNKLKC
jgi:hypothetical protein